MKTQCNQKLNRQKKQNPGEEGESDFQSSYIIKQMSKAPQSQAIPRNKKVQPIQSGKNSTKSIPGKDLTADVWDKDFKARW